MLAGFASKGNSALVLGLLAGLAVLAAIKATPAQPRRPQ
jgi:uncharacterized membrane protein